MTTKEEQAALLVDSLQDAYNYDQQVARVLAYRDQILEEAASIFDSWTLDECPEAAIRALKGRAE